MSDDGPGLTGHVEVDETYVGGKPRPGNNKHRKKGRGTSKTPVVALVERDGRVRAKAVASVSSRNLKGAIYRHVEREAVIYTDEWPAYKGIGISYAGHKTVNHGWGEYMAPDGTNTTTVESYFALLKRGVYGTFHNVSPKHLTRYCHEFSFRWNYRKASDEARTLAALRGANGKRLTYRQPNVT
jgi:transposase-like protein